MASTSNNIGGIRSTYPTSSTALAGGADDNMELDSTQKSLSIFATMRTPVAEADNVFAIFGGFSNRWQVTTLPDAHLNFEDGVRDCPLSSFAEDTPDYDRAFVIQKRHFEVSIPSAFEKDGSFCFFVGRRNLDPLQNRFLDREVLLNKEIFSMTFDGSQPAPAKISPIFQSEAESYSILARYYLKETNKLMGEVTTADPQLKASMDALKTNPKLIGSVEKWGIPFIQRLIGETKLHLQNDPDLLASLSAWADSVKADPRTFPLLREALLQLMSVEGITNGEGPSDTPFAKQLNALRARFGHLFLNDPQTASAWAALEKSPALLSSAHLWAFPLLHRAVTLVQKDPEAMQSISTIGQYILADIEKSKPSASSDLGGPSSS